MSGKRSQRAQLAQETVAILHACGYIAPPAITFRSTNCWPPRSRVRGTYPPTEPVAHSINGSHETQFTVTNETTLAAAHRLSSAGHRVVARSRRLCVGEETRWRLPESAPCPGGRGAVRASALYPCIANNEMYQYHRAQGDAMYSSYAIYSPDVPVIRDDNGQLLNAPWPCSFITCAAVNAGAMQWMDDAAIERAMEDRVRKVLAIAVVHGHEAIVLGPGLRRVPQRHRNDRTALPRCARQRDFGEPSAAVSFAVLDGSDDRHFIAPFEAPLPVDVRGSFHTRRV